MTLHVRLYMGSYKKSGLTVAATFAFYVAVTGTSALSQTVEENAALCGSPDPDVRIKACTELLSDSAYDSTSLTTVYSNRGVGYSERKQPSLAIRDFDRAIEAWPSNASAYSNRGLAYDDIGQPQRAIEDFNTAIKADPKSSAAYNNRCYVLTKIGRPKEALSDCEQASKLAPGSAQMLDSLGYVHFRLEQYSQAIEAYNAALKASPNLVPSLYARGVAREKLGDKLGNNDIRAAIEIDKTIADKMAKMGVIPESFDLAAAQTR